MYDLILNAMLFLCSINRRIFFYLEPKLESESELESELIGLSPEPMKIKPPQKILDLPLRTGIYR